MQGALPREERPLVEGCHSLAILSASQVRKALCDPGAHSSLSLSGRSEARALPARETPEAEHRGPFCHSL